MKYRLENLWKANNTKILCWILSSIEAHFYLTLRPCIAAHDMWSHLKKYAIKKIKQGNFKLNSKLENRNSDKAIQEYYIRVHGTLGWIYLLGVFFCSRYCSMLSKVFMSLQKDINSFWVLEKNMNPSVQA